MKPRLLSATLAMLLLAPSAPAATLFWDGTDTNANANGGSGIWNTSTANWDTAASGGANAVWNNATPDSAVFSGTAGTVTLGTNITTGGLRFNTTGYTLNHGANILTFGSGSSVVFNNTAGATLTGAVGGSGSLSLSDLSPTSPGTLTLNGTSAGGWSGATTVNTGMSLGLSGANQALFNTSGISLNGGNIRITNNSTQASLNRVGDTAPITSNGGIFEWNNLPNVLDQQFYAETVGTVTLASGQTEFNLTGDIRPSVNYGLGQRLYLAGLQRTGANNTSVVEFNVPTGVSAGACTVVGVPPTPANQIIGPWATTGVTNYEGATDYAVHFQNSVFPFSPSRGGGPAPDFDDTTAAWNDDLIIERNLSIQEKSRSFDPPTTLNVALTDNRTINTLRFFGNYNIALNLGAFNLAVNGLMGSNNGWVTGDHPTPALTQINSTGGGALSTPNGSTALYLTTGFSGLTVNAPITDNTVPVTLVKSGRRTLTLTSSNSTFSGGIVINSGIVEATTLGSLGSGSLPITFNGNGRLQPVSGTNIPRGIAINNGAVAEIGGGGTYTFTGNVTGNGGIAATASSSWFFSNNPPATTATSSNLFLNGSANTLQGPLIVGLGSAAGLQSYQVSVASLVDSPTANGSIQMMSRATDATNASVFAYTGSTPLVLNHRQIDLAANGNPTNGHQIRSNGGGTLTINTDLGVSTTADQTLSLGGSNTGANVFNGKIADGTVGAGAVVGLRKGDTGNWDLTNANTFTGSTTVSGGTLRLSGAGSFGNGNYAGAISIDGILAHGSSANQIFSGAISGAGTLLKDTSASTLTLGSGASNFSGAITVNAGTLVAAGSASFGSTSGLGQPSNTRTITVGSGAALRFDIGNVLSTTFTESNLPSLVVTSGTVTNNFANNNPLGNVTLNNATLTATAGSATQGAFNLNGTVTATGTSLISSSEPVNGRMMLAGGGTSTTTFAVTNPADTLTISAPLADVASVPVGSGLIKSGGGTLILNGVNSYRLSTTVNAGTLTVGSVGTLGAPTAALTVSSTGVASTLNLATGVDTTVGRLTGAVSGGGTATINTGGLGRNFTVNQTGTNGAFAGVISGDGNFTLGPLSTVVLTLSGTPNFTGSTTVLAGTLRLGYSATASGSKLSNTAPLILGGGTLDLAGTGATHTEEVGSTTLNAGTASSVTRSSGASVLQMNTINVGAGATVNFGANNIATTDNPNGPAGLLGAWATVAGANWAVNSTNSADGLITAYSAYTDVARQTAGVIADGAATNVRIIEGSGVNNIKLAANPTLITINTLNQSTSGGSSAATIDLEGRTLRTNAILVGTGAGALTIGTVPNNGTLAAATAGGDLALNTISANALTINSAIANNGSASSLSKVGAGVLNLAANNSYTGATVVAAGTLNLTGSISGSAITVSGGAVLTEAASGVIGGSSSLTLTSTATSTLAGTNTHNGGTTLNSGNLILANAAALGSGAFTLGGGNFNTDGSVTALANNIPQNWNSGFTYGGASSLNLGTGAVTLGANAQVTVAANTLTVGGAIGGNFGIAKAGPGTLVLNGNNAHLGGTTLTGATDSGTLVLGNAGALGTGPLTINGAGANRIDSAVANLVNANNNLQNWQADFTFVGSNNLNLGTGAVTLLGNRAVTVQANTLTIGGGIGGGFDFTKAGAGAMILTGVSTYTGTTNISGGALTIGGAGSLGGGNYAAAITNDGGLIYSSSAAQTLGGVISGGGPLTKSGSSTLTLTNANTYGGGTTISNGTLTLGNGALQGSVTGTITNNAALAVNNNNAQTVANTITGSGSLTKNGTGVLTLSGFNSYQGLTQITEGTVSIADPDALGDFTSGTVVSPGAALASDSTLKVLDEPLTLSGTGVSATGALRVGNSKTLTWDGPVTLAAPALMAAAAGSNFVLPSLGTVALGANALTVQLDGSAVSTLSGVISGVGGSLIKTGAATLALNAANNFTGLTTVSAGALRLQNPDALGTTAAGTTVAAGAQVELDNLTVSGEAITLAGTGANGFGALQGRPGFSLWAGNVALDADGTRIGTSSTNNQLEVSGVIDDGVNDYRLVCRPFAGSGSLLILSGANTYTGGTSIIGGRVQVTSLNRVVGGTPSSSFGAPVTAANGQINFGSGSNLGGTLNYVGNGETTDRTIQIGLDSPTPVPSDNGGATIESNGFGPLVFSAPNFNTPANAPPESFAFRTLTLGGSNTDANTIAGVIRNNVNNNIPSPIVNLTKTGNGTWILAGDNTYTGETRAYGGILTLAGNRTSDAGAVFVASGGLLKVQGNLPMGSSLYGVGYIEGTPGAVEHSAGTTSFSGGNGWLRLGAATSSFGSGTTGTYTLSGTGVISMTSSASLRVGSEVNCTGTFNQTSDTSVANIDQLMVSEGNFGTTGTLNLSAGTFTAESFPWFAAGNSSIAIMNISGTADVTLPAFPTTRGSGATATLTFDGGTLRPKAASTSYISGLTNAFIKAGGAKINTGNGSITITQDLLEDFDSAGGGLTKEGTNALTLTGASTYTGATLVNAGTLLVNNTSGTGTGSGNVTVNTGTLGGTGNIQGTVTIGNGTGSADAILAPGNSIGTISSGSLAFLSDGSYAVELDGTSATCDAIDVSGTVTIQAATTLQVAVTGTLSGNQKFFIVINRGPDPVTGTFSGRPQDTVVGTYGGTALKISYTGDFTTAALTGGNDIVLYTEAGSAYDLWAQSKGLTGANNGKGDDPDKDGRNNLSEFAFDGNPLSGANDGKVVGKLATLVSLDKVMTLTLPVRANAIFGDLSGPELAGPIDGIYYRIEGGTNLVTFADNVTEVTGTDAANIQTGLPGPLTPGWSYRTFRVSGTSVTQPKVFLRARISETP